MDYTIINLTDIKDIIIEDRLKTLTYKPARYFADVIVLCKSSELYTVECRLLAMCV